MVNIIKSTQSKRVKFKVTELLDPVKQGGRLYLGGVFKGIQDGKKVWFTDSNEVEWCFYIGVTCEIVKQKFTKNMKKPELFNLTPLEIQKADERLVKQYLTKTITITVSKEEAEALTHVISDTLDYYSTLRENQQELRTLRLALVLIHKIINKIY